ncbi:hypothetical protein FO519_006354 [Halicephalobus sp. NKZ332]|nr:hypothetical protein FO519_006354 [Halicephalobus sp. NKZ332]
MFGRFLGNNDIVTSLMNLVSKVGERALEDEKIKIYGDEYIQKQGVRGYTTNQRRRVNSGAAKAESAKEVQLDEPIPIPTESFSVDSHPESVATDSKFPQLNGEWKSTLFGPKGLLTEVFHFVNEKRKQGSDKAPQSDLPSTPQFDFGKVFDAILMKSGDGFDDPKIPELPFIGICNRVNCGDIYKALDQFKKSEVFSNFQTALSLFQDPKGLDIIEQLLENPELIEQFAGKPENIGELLGKAEGSAKSRGNSNGHSMSILPSDGDLGIDFTSEIEPKKIGKPEISANIDGTDYYSAVEKEGPSSSVDYDYESVNVEETISPTTTTIIKTTTEANMKKTEPPLPELSFSVDEAVDSVDSLPEYGSVVDIEEAAPINPKSQPTRKVSPSAMERRFENYGSAKKNNNDRKTLDND